MTAQTLPKRNQVSAEQTWDLTDLYRDWNHWNDSLQALPPIDKVSEKLKAEFEGKLDSDPAVLKAALEFRSDLSARLTNLYTYAALRSSENTADAVASGNEGKVSTLSAQYLSLFAFYGPELLASPKLKTLASSPALKSWKSTLDEISRGQPHVLSSAEEAILAQLSPVTQQFAAIHSKWLNADTVYENAVDSTGKTHMVTNGRLTSLMESSDRVLRESAWKISRRELSRMRNTVAANFNGACLAASLSAKVRRFEGYFAAELFPDNCPVELYESLLTATKNALPSLHESVKLRKDVLGVDDFRPWDRLVPLSRSQTGDQRWSWDEAVDLILDACAPLGEEYVKIARKGMKEERWADYCENEGKRSGAFSWGTYDSRPYMLMTWTGTLYDVFTLAHELGHSMHSWFSNHHQERQNASYSIFVAEVASTLNENLLARHILKTRAGTPLAREVLMHELSGFEGTVFRQVQFAAFEKAVAERIDAGESLGADDFDGIFRELNGQWYGPTFSGEPLSEQEWMRVPHFYSSFYVYKYATSHCASSVLAESLSREGKAAQERVLGFLKAGSSELPIDILKAAGVDMLNPLTLSEAFAGYARHVKAARQELLG